MTDETPEPGTSDDPTGGRSHGLIKAAVLVLFVAAFVVVSTQFSLDDLARREEALQRFRDNSPVLVYGAAFLIYAAVSGLSLPIAAPLTIAYGWFFGVVPGIILVSFASTTGATIAFLLSRFLFRDAIQRKFGNRISNFNEALEKEGAFYLFSLRLIPAVPFFVINAVMGLTPIKTSTYWWVSQVGMLPGTAVYVYAGSTIPGLQKLADDGVGQVLSWQVALAFTLLGLFPLVVKKLMGLFRSELPIDSPGSHRIDS